MLKKLKQPSLLSKIWDKDWTKLLSYLKMASGALLLSISEINGYVNNPTMKGYLDELDLPKTITIGLIVMGMLVYIACPHGQDEDA